MKIKISILIKIRINQSIPNTTRVPRRKSSASEPTAVVAKTTSTPSCFKAQRLAR
jgi:hypothetical protein